MVGERPGARGRRLDRVVARGGEGPGRSLAPSPCERAGVNERAGPEGEGVRVEGHDDVGLAEVVARLDVLAECETGTGTDEVAARRLPLMPARLREDREQLPDLRRERRRRDRRRQQAEAFSADRAGRLHARLKLFGERRPRTDLAELRDRLRTVRVVERKDRRLRKKIRRAEARGMLRVAFHFRRAAGMGFDEDARGVSAEREGGRGKKQGGTGGGG